MERYEAYKDSGIEWLGEIPVGWEVVPIKFNLSMRVTDGPHETPEFINEGVPFISAEAIKNDRIDFGKKRGNISWEDHHRYSMKYKPKRGDVYMVKSGATTGNLARVETDIEFNIWSPLAALRPEAKFLLTDFLFFFMKSRVFLTAVELGWNYGTQQNIGMNVIENLRMVRPPLREQTAIANYLDSKTEEIDALIAQKERLLELYEEEKTAIINHAVTKGIDPTAELKDSGIEWLGKIPVAWEVKKTKYLLKKNRGAIKAGPFGSQIKNSDLTPLGEFKVYTQRNVLDENYAKGEDRIDYAKFNALKEFEVKPGDILFTTRGTIGRCSVFPSDMQRGVLHPCLIRIQIDEQLVLPEWIVAYANNSSFFIENVKLESNSTIIDVIYGSTLKEVSLPIPPREEQIAIVQHIEGEIARIDAKIAKAQRIIELQKEYRTALISEVVTGKIKTLHLVTEEVQQ